MKKQLELLLNELLYLKRDGINHIYCEEDTLNQLKLALKGKISATDPENSTLVLSENIKTNSL